MVSALEKNLIQRVALGDIFRRRARTVPRSEAVVEYRGEKRLCLDYKTLNTKLNQFVYGLRSLGVKQGDRVALMGPNSLEYLICLYGCAKGGFQAVPINPLLNPKDILYILQHASIETLILDDQLYPPFKDFIPFLDFIRNFVILPTTGQGTGDPFHDFNSLLADQPDTEVEDVLIADRDNFEILYTSGTTSAPKGVEISHLTVFLMSLSNIAALTMGKDLVGTTLLPLFHCAQQTVTTSLLHLGAKTVVCRGFDPQALLSAIEQERLGLMFCLPAMYRALLDHPACSSTDFSSLKKCIYAMTPMDKPTLIQGREIFGADFVLGTGQTEFFPASNCLMPEWQLEKEGNYWGESVLTVDTAIMDEDGNLLPPGEVGEIVWRGPAVMSGYLKNPEATDQAWAHGWHHSGDLGYFDDDGLLVFVDRKKDMIKTGGENVPSIKVEQVILGHPKVEAVAVVGLPHEKWVEAVTAFVQPALGRDLTAQEILEFCREKLGKFEIPKEIIIVAELPKTATGKLQKNILRQEYQDYYLKSSGRKKV